MKKIVIHRAGGFERLNVETCPDPVPGDESVVVQTKAIGVNFADCIVRMGLYASAREYVGWPITPGFEFSGTVAAVGKRVQNLSVGTKVFGITRFNAYATHVVVPREFLFVIPPNMTFEQAAAFPTVFLTAYYALHMVVRIYEGSVILIHSAAGGVGSALLQLCRQAGWYSVGVVGSASKVEAAKAMGADVVIDKSSTDLWQAVEELVPQGFDVILDGNGATTLKQGQKHLKPTGKLISYGFHSMFPRRSGLPNYVKLAYDFLRTPRFSPLTMHQNNWSLVTFNLSFLFDRTDLFQKAMKSLYSWLQAGEIKVPEVTPYRFEDVADAHRDLQSGLTSGKLVLIPESR